MPLTELLLYVRRALIATHGNYRHDGVGRAQCRMTLRNCISADEAWQRPERLTPHARSCWVRMLQAAFRGKNLFIVQPPWPGQPGVLPAVVVRIGLRHELRVDNIVVSLGATSLLEVTCVPSVWRDGSALLDPHTSDSNSQC